MEKETVLILLDYHFGPIQCDWTDEEGRQITRIPAIDSDEETQRLNKEANALSNTLRLVKKPILHLPLLPRTI